MKIPIPSLSIPHIPKFKPRMPAFRNLITARRPRLEWYFFIALGLYAVFCIFIYFHYVAPWISGHTNIRIGADSDRFWEFAKEDDLVLISVTQNSFGMVALARTLKSGFSVMAFNFALLIIALKIAFTIPRINKGLFGFLLLLNAELLPSITTLNKEIFALLAAAMTVKYFHSRSKLLLLATLFISACARWESVAFLLLYLIASRLGLRSRPKILLFLIILTITLLYPFAFKIVGVNPDSFDYLLEGSNTILKLNALQNAFGFPLVILPKTLMLLGGGWASPKFYTDNVIFTDGFFDYQQGIFQPLGCLLLTGIFILALKSGRLSLDRPVAMMSFITILMTEASPFIQPRYVFGVYVMLAIEMSKPQLLLPRCITDSVEIRIHDESLNGRVATSF
jgi:hypothetical protein